jgi:hypothetical protein
MESALPYLDLAGTCVDLAIILVNKLISLPGNVHIVDA